MQQTATTIAKAVSPYIVETANIKAFFKEQKTISQWQDWLHKRMPKLKAVTGKTPAYLPRMGSLNANEPHIDRATIYTDLLTCLCALGQIERVRLPHTTLYKTAVDKGAKPSYTPNDPF